MPASTMCHPSHHCPLGPALLEAADSKLLLGRDRLPLVTGFQTLASRGPHLTLLSRRPAPCSHHPGAKGQDSLMVDLLHS